MTNPGPNYPIHGIDVSHFQGKIQWQRVSKSGVKFAYIKASEGASLRDRRFSHNWKNAAAAGIIPGAYHFFTLCKSGKQQADNFIGALRDSPLFLPPAVDLEFKGNCRRRPSVGKFTQDLMNFLNLVQEVSPCQPILYTTYEFYQSYLRRNFKKQRFWIRDLQGEVKFEGPWVLWQYTNQAKLSGIVGKVDKNVFRGGTKKFNQFLCHGDRNSRKRE